MPRSQILVLSAVNVTVHPHPAGIYKKLLQTSYVARLHAKVQGERWGMISQLYNLPSNLGVSGLQGVISTFTHLDKNLPWFNENTTDDATPSELGEIRVPDHLQPNHRRCNFVLDDDNHLLIFESSPGRGGISPNSMVRFLNLLFSDERVFRLFGKVQLTLVPDPDSVESILRWDAIKTLIIRVTKPNPGDFSEEDFEEIEKRLSDQNADRVEQVLHAEENKYLRPDEQTKTFARIASENGFVEARGAGQKKSTKSLKPLVKKEPYDPDIETHADSLF